MIEDKMSLDFFVEWFKSDLVRFYWHVSEQPEFSLSDEPFTWEEWEREFDKFLQRKRG